MNKLIIVGHPQSGYREIERQVNICGMYTAKPSKRDGFTPQQIISTLCKVHGAIPLDKLSSEDDAPQIEPNPVWNGMALDLMLGNIDTPFWGWSDPQAIYLLNYWRDLDPDITFVLVYDNPQSILTQASNEEFSSLTDELLSQQVSSWNAYNGALLRFFHRNPQRCLLVHSEQIHVKTSDFFHQLFTRIDAPVSKQAKKLMLSAEDANHGNEYEVFFDHDTQQIDLRDNQYSSTPKDEVLPPTENAHTLYLADTVIEQHPTSLQCYEELQAVADLPLSDELEKEFSATDAWRSLAAQLQHQKTSEQLAANQKQIITKLEQTVQKHNKLTKEVADKTARIASLQADLDKQKTDIVAKLEQTVQQHNKLTKEVADKTVRIASLQADLDKNKTGIAEPDIENVIELRDENKLLLNQLHEVQEELERYYLENQSLKTNSSNQLAMHYGAGERIKQLLSYRLGAAMITHSRNLTGWLMMPWALLSETRRLNHEKTDSKVQNLPPIKQYQDAHDADRMQQHLSYRLGKSFMTNTHSPVGWVKLPYALHKEVKDFRSRRQAA